jgi:hypothetical protein
MGGVALAEIVHVLDRAASRRGSVEQRLDRLLLLVDELAATPKELHAVVRGRVVRGGDDDAELVREERDRGSRKDAAESRHASGRGDPSSDSLLELGPRRARIATDEHASAAGPQRRGLPDALDEVGREVDARDPAHAVRAEVAPRHRGGSYLFEN